MRLARYAYALTPMGADLKPPLLAPIEWGNRHIAGTFRPTAERPRQARGK